MLSAIFRQGELFMQLLTPIKAAKKARNLGHLPLTLRPYSTNIFLSHRLLQTQQKPNKRRISDYM